MHTRTQRSWLASTGTDLQGANLSYAANLTNAGLQGANLSYVTLSNAALSGANLTSANLFGTNLTGADLTNALLSGVNAGTTATTANVIWNNTICPDHTNSDNNGNTCLGHGF